MSTFCSLPSLFRLRVLERDGGEDKNLLGIDGLDRLVRLIRLVRLQTDNFRFLFLTNGETIIFRFHDEQTVNGLRKIAWASVFRFPSEAAA
jgi:hypothetical protein